MEVYKTPSKEIQDIVFANVTYETVIYGLNGYFASESRNNYITVKMESDKQDFALYEAEAWADILISWLRKKHDIFYYPGMEAKHAKIERIPPLTERLMDEGALNSLKDLHKRVTGEEAGTNSHTLIADAIRCSVYEKESEIEELKGRIAELESNFKAVCDEDDIFRTRALKAEEEVKKLKEQLDKVEGAQKEVKQECYDYLWNALKKLSPDCDTLKILKIDRYEDLVDRIFYEMSLVNDGCKLCRRDHSIEKFDYIQRTNKAKEEVKKLKEQLDKATADYQALSEENQKHKNAEKADTNKLIRECCTEHGIVAPSRYLSDEACIEYLFSVSVTILQDIYRDIFKRQPDGLSAKDIANKILDRILTTEDLLHRSVDSVNKECKATGRLMVDKYEKDLLRFIYKEYKGRTHLSDETVTYDPPSVRNTVLKIISDYARSRTRVDILETRIKSIFDRCKAKFTVDDYVLNGDPTTSFMLDCISSWIDSPAPRDGWTNREIENLSGQIKRLKDLINAMNEEVEDM